MKVAHFINDLDGSGGAEQMLLKVLPHLEGEHFVISMLGKGDIGPALEEKGIRVFSMDFNGRNIWDMLNKMRIGLKNEKPDILNTYLVPADLIGRFLGRLSGIKNIVCSVRNRFSGRKFYLLLDNLTSFMVTKYTPNSTGVYDFMKVWQGVDESKLFKIPNCVEVSKFDKGPRSIRLKGSPLIIGCVASFKTQKDHVTLINAFSVLTKKVNAKLILVGKGALKSQIETLVSDLGLTSQVEFRGVITDIPSFLNEIEVFVLPSLHEGMSNALLEAMASRVGIIVSDIMENRELIKDGTHGLLFKPGDHLQLCAKFLDYYTSPNLVIKHGEAAYNKVKNEYSIQSAVIKTDVFYKNIFKVIK